LDAGAVEQRRESYMGEGGGFPRVRAIVNQVSLYCPWLVPTPRVFSNSPTCGWFLMQGQVAK